MKPYVLDYTLKINGEREFIAIYVRYTKGTTSSMGDDPEYIDIFKVEDSQGRDITKELTPKQKSLLWEEAFEKLG